MISYFRNCKRCGFCLFHNQFKPIDFFCEKCWYLLEKEKTKIGFKIYKSQDIFVKPLYLWKEKESVVGDLIHGLKGGTPMEIIERLSLEIAFREKHQKDIVTVPVPSSKVGDKDHAFQMAKCISQKLNVELWNGLIWKEKSTNQKFLKKTERFDSTMEKTLDLPAGKRVVLIDDLVTTGATTMAAFKAIKGLNQMEVWALACRI